MALLAMTGCSQKSALQEQVQALQNAMPLNFMEGAQVSAISLDQSLNLTIDVDEDHHLLLWPERKPERPGADHCGK